MDAALSPFIGLPPETFFAAGPALAMAGAIQQGEATLLGQLLAAHPAVDLNRPAQQGMSLALWAYAHRRPECLRVLAGHGADLSRRLTLPGGKVGSAGSATHLLNLAVLDPDDEVLTTLLLLGANPSTKNEHGAPALHTTLLAANFDRMRQLIRHGADFNGTDRAGTTAITLLARADNFEQVYYLLQQGADFRKPHDEVALRTQESDSGDEATVAWQIKVKQKLMARGVRFPVPRPGAARYARFQAQWEQTLEGRDWRLKLNEFGSAADVVGPAWVARADEAFAALQAWMQRQGIAEPPN